MDIADWRKKIDELDREMVHLLNERARCSLEIGQIKRTDGLPIQEPRREREVFQQALEASSGPLEDGALQRIFQQIVEECRGLQRELSNKKNHREPGEE